MNKNKDDFKSYFTRRGNVRQKPTVFGFKQHTVTVVSDLLRDQTVGEIIDNLNPKFY